MRTFVAGFCVGCSILWIQTRLLQPFELGFICLSLSLLWLCRRQFNSEIFVISRALFLGLSLGVVWGNMNAAGQLSSRLPFYNQPIDATVVGEICSIPQIGITQTRFEFCVESIDLYTRVPFNDNEQSVSSRQINSISNEKPKRLSIAWYHTRQVLEPGDEWTLSVKLKTPYSVLNPFGFDLERWSLLNEIDASGYVIAGKKRPKDSFLSIDAFRNNANQQLEQRLAGTQFLGWHLALVTGNRISLTPRDRLLLSDTGTSHLMAISGLHIGLVFFWTTLLIRYVSRKSTKLCLFMPAEQFSLYLALAVTWSFTLFTGAELPTQRAAIAISLFVISQNRLIYWSSYKLFSITLLILLIHEPLSVLSEGFWLTVVALAVILWFLEITGDRRWYHWFCLQLLLSILMASFSAVIFGGFSINAWLANIVAIPMISFVILPLDLLALSVVFIPPFCESLFLVSDTFLAGLFRFLSLLQEFFPVIHLEVDTSRFGLIFLALLFLVIRLKIEFLSLFVGANLVILFCSIIWLDNEQKGAEVHFMDIGQGLSVVIHHRGRWIVYDTGFGNENFSVASRTLVPFLSRHGVSTIDLLIVSHQDKDHSGGIDALTEHFSVDRIIMGEPPDKRFAFDYETCEDSTTDIGDLRLHWKQAGDTGNDSSCVLAVDLYNKRVLLTGDIEKKAELELLSRSQSFMSADVISLPHHGSKTSSTWSFITQVKPKIAVASSGYLNRFGHPAASVVERYKALQSLLLTTWRSGMITVQVRPGKPLKIKQYRDHSQKFWNHRSSSDILGNAVVN